MKKAADKALIITRLILIVVAVSVIAGLGYLWRTGLFDQGGGLWLALGLLILLGMAPMLGLLVKHNHQGILILWCRRFSKSDLDVGKRNRWLWAVMAEAFRDVAIPVTIRDRSLVGSQSVGRSIQNPLSAILILLGTPLWLWAMLTALKFVDGSLPEFIVCALGLVGYVLMFKLIAYIVEWVTTSLSAHEGDPETIKTRLRKIRRQGSSSRELDALRCTDDTWQACILAVLNEINFVIIDNVDSSENIDWEIQQSIEKVGRHRVFMLLRTEAEEHRQVTPVYFDFDAAETEINSMKDSWGDDDFGESEALGAAGMELAAILKKLIIPA